MIKVIKTIKEICNAYKNFYIENLHTNCGDKKPQDLRLQI